MYHRSYRYHQLFRRVYWMPVLGIALALMSFALLASSAWSPLLVTVAIGLVGVWTLGFVFWIVFSAWYDVQFRYLAWWTARGAGGLWRWLTTGWRAAIVLLAAVTLMMWVRAWIIGFPRRPSEFLTAELALKVAALTMLLALINWAYQVRGRLVILPFKDYTGDEQLKTCVEGLAARLLNELVSLSELYKIIDEMRPSTTHGAIDVTVNVEDVGQELQAAVSADSKVSLGPLQIPIGAILAFVGRIVQGPRLVGSLHKEDNKLVLIAKTYGGRLGGSWRVKLDDLPDQRAAITAEAIDKMIEQLAYRVFTDWIKIGSPVWRAVRSYTDGLRRYRETKRTGRERTLKLLQAERAFIQARAEDTEFAQAHYNLGVVYRELQKAESARAAFWQALKLDPNQPMTYYALALTHQDNPTEVIRLCDQIIRLRPGEAQAWDLKGLAQRWRLGPIEPGPNPMWREITESREIATALAWRAMCRSAMKHRLDDKLKDIARTCTRNLGVAYAMTLDVRSKGIGYRLRFRAICQTFNQAIYLEPTDAELHFELAKVLDYVGNWAEAARAFENALGIEERPEFWARLADTQASLFGKTGNDEYRRASQNASRRALNYASDADDKTLQWTRSAWEKTNAEVQTRRVDLIPDILKLLQKQQSESAEDYTTRLEKLLPCDSESIEDYIQRVQEVLSEKRVPDNRESIENYIQGIHDVSPNMWDWAYAQIAIRLAQSFLSDQQPDPARQQQYLRAQRYLEESIEKLKEEHLIEIQNEGLYGLLARAYRFQGNIADALLHAEQAVALVPTRAWERTELGSVYFTLNDYERAEAEWNIALDFSPSDYNLLQYIASTYWSRGIAVYRPERRRQAFQRVIEIFGRALDMMESTTLSSDSKEDQVQARGAAHYWLGIFHHELLEYDQAISHLKIAQAMGFKPLESRVRIGLAYFKARAYNEAQQTFADAVAEACKQRRKVRSSTEWAEAPGEEYPINDLLAETYLYWAFMYAKRGGGLERATHRIRNAKWRIAKVKAENPLRPQFEATYHVYLGWIYFKQKRLDDAIRELERAMELAVDAEGYYHLAEVCYACAIHKEYGRAGWLNRAREACRYAREADLSGEYSQPIDDLLKRADSLA